MTAISKNSKHCRLFSRPRSAVLLSVALVRRNRLSAPFSHRPSLATLRRVLTAAVVLALTSSIVSTVAVYPHELSYFNEITGGPLNAHLHILDANLDWGQDLLELKRWCEAGLGARSFHVAYFGFVDPSIAGLTRGEIPRLATLDVGGAEVFPQIQAVGACYAISANHLYGYRHFGEMEDGYSWLRRHRSVGHAGYSIHIYDDKSFVERKNRLGTGIWAPDAQGHGDVHSRERRNCAEPSLFVNAAHSHL